MQNADESTWKDIILKVFRLNADSLTLKDVKRMYEAFLAPFENHIRVAPADDSIRNMYAYKNGMLKQGPRNKHKLVKLQSDVSL